MRISEHAVAIVGGGPTGLMLAGELALAGVDAAIVERRPNQDLAGSRAGGLHSRTIEVLDQRGIAGRFIAQGKPHPVVHFHVPLKIDDFPTRHNYVLGLWQNQIERILAEWVGELGVTIYRECDVTSFAQDETCVDVTLADGRALRAQYLVGCDGGRSVVRKAAGIAFPGYDPTTSWLIAEAEFADGPKWGMHQDARGLHGIGRADNGTQARIVLTEDHVAATGEPDLRDVSAALTAIYGSDFGIHSPAWISRFTDMTRQAAAYRDRRVLLAGDAAHVHPPVGGQGLNVGVQDSVNLGWKLAQVIRRVSPESLLDSYHAERHPVGARVLRNTMAQVALRRTDERSKALADTMSELLALDGPRQRQAAEMAGLDIRYDFGDGHPLLGRRMPDLDLVAANGPLRMFDLLRAARPVLLNFGEPGSLDIAVWSARVPQVDVACANTNDADAWQLPVLGAVAAPAAVLVRPDGYVAWVGDTSRAGLVEALTKWFGAVG